MRPLIILGLALSVLLPAAQAGNAQSLPHEMKLDTPPPPGLIEETHREKLKPGPSLSADKPVGLMTSGAKATKPPRLDPVSGEVLQRRLDFNRLY